MKQITAFGQMWNRVWIEDDCAPDAERFTTAWRRLYNCPFPGNDVATCYEDLGDADMYVIRGLLIIHAVDGSSIYEPVRS